MTNPTRSAREEARPPRKKASDRVAEMLDIVDATLNENRTANFSMKDVGAAAGASRALVYAYFDDQFQLLDALLNRHVELLCAAGLEAAAGRGTLTQCCVAAGEIYLRHIAEHGMALEIVLREKPVARQLSGRARPFRAAILRRLATLAARELAMGANEALTLVQLLAVIPGDAGRLIYEGTLSLEDGLELNSRLVATSIEALRPAPVAPTPNDGPVAQP
ncbi:TetR/AcrR family transcriptional regulator [uncultured Sphingomonas sp.]|uniref:TetR/AcrR family transcriptional regulator n=1 Tax=uncultured Sphingomonas sp. TaxID=158754 RepID=UPI0025CD3A62|nr:TetR/AcrR family transcriptional regulator [uncultured Sphingomonas sp.]